MIRRIFLLPAAIAAGLVAQTWKPAVSANPLPHFEKVNGKRVFFSDGVPLTVLTVETHWDELIYSRYSETMRVYNYMYPAAAAMGLNALKVPIKWSVVEPAEGVYDFSYVDHVRQMAERHHLKLVLCWFGHYASGAGTLYSNMQGDVFAPMYIIKDTARFPRAVDGEGKAHHDAASYDYPAIVERETLAFRAFMEHLRRADTNRTVLMIQVENEVAVFGAGADFTWRRIPKFWRDHSPASNRRFQEKGFKSELAYSAWSLAANWLRPVTDAGVKAYPIPFFMNFVGGSLEEGMLGGSPGEDVATYLDHIPSLSFIGVNHYPTWGDHTPAPVSVPASALRKTLDRYRVGRNIPTLTETNSDNSPLAPRFVFISVGEYGSPLFAPWALSSSCPTEGEPYVQKDGTLANGAFALREAYTAIRKGGPAIAQLGGTERAKVFLAEMPGHRFKETKDVAGVAVTVAGVNNGQAIAIRASDNEVLIVGFRCTVALRTDGPSVKVERGAWTGADWKPEGAVRAEVTNGEVRFRITEPQAARILW
ncbi:MAG TPA: hypothetical protein VN428_19655 [Bryobacteraceae bacterium]|nr:hypothetical protein [Bryobacteraceae bacterium]